ncbi:sulfotransferase [Prochlorococcus marinus]|nr:sulfotransferase [Prochlorococcus marinus]
MARKKLLLIRGLGHSGTTILDLALGSHPSMIGLGEALRILRTPSPGEGHRGPARLRAELRHQRLCTCGRTASSCPVWGPLLEWLPAHDHYPLVEKLQQLLAEVDNHVKQQGDAIEWMVESYQDDMVLPFVDDPALEIRILYLTRDVRSWVHSRSRDGRHKKHWLPALKPLLRWCRVNARQERLLQVSGRPVFRLGYEQLALDPETSLRRLCTWLEIPFDEQMLQPAQHSTSHILAGNRMRFDANRGASIRYDGAWLGHSSSLVQLALLLPWVRQLNQRLVYSKDHLLNHESGSM